MLVLDPLLEVAQRLGNLDILAEVEHKQVVADWDKRLDLDLVVVQLAARKVPDWDCHNSPLDHLLVADIDLQIKRIKHVKIYISIIYKGYKFYLDFVLVVHTLDFELERCLVEEDTLHRQDRVLKYIQFYLKYNFYESNEFNIEQLFLTRINAVK